MKEESFYQDKIDGLFNHLRVADSDEKTAAYVIENLGKHIDKRAQTITEGICHGLDITELIHLFNLVEKRLPQNTVPPSPENVPRGTTQPPKKTTSVKRRKSTR